MNSAVETLSPTRVKLTVEVPFEELTPSLDAAYRKVAGQIRVPGFRPGKVPPRIIDQRVGRGAVLEEAVNEAIPRFYGEAVEAAEVRVLSQPEVEITHFGDGEQLTFTAEIDVRPAIELPELDKVPVTVDDFTVTDSDVDEKVAGLADGFATLSTAERPAQDGDFVTIDLSLTADGRPVEDGAANGLSYEVGSGSLIEGLDSAIVGLSAGESAEFDAPLAGPLAGQAGRAHVTVKAVRVKQLPAIDDDFAQAASEFDSLDELRGEMRERLERTRRLEQGIQARDKLVEVLLEKIDIPLPERVVKAEIDARAENLQRRLDAGGLDLGAYLASQNETREEHETHVAADVEHSLRAQFILDAIVAQRELVIEEAELTEYIVRQAVRLGVTADEYAGQLVKSGTVPLVVADVLRGKALAQVLEQATVTDASGRPVDISRLEQDSVAAREAAAAHV